MTTPQEAIEAAAQAIFEELQELDQDNSWDDLPDEWRQEWLHTAREGIEAAMPHIREQIADEIEARIPAPSHTLATTQNQALSAAISVAIGQGMKLAARTAKGES
jgi:hypothetical protein